MFSANCCPESRACSMALVVCFCVILFLALGEKRVVCVFVNGDEKNERKERMWQDYYVIRLELHCLDFNRTQHGWKIR